MLNVFDVAKTLVHQIEKVYSEDIALVAYYGSYAQGTATKRSDLDFFFIPATPEGYGASIQFIIDDISFDFWPISWERAASMASFEEFKTSIIADCKLLYVRSEEDRERFMKLREPISSMQSPENRRNRVGKAEAEFCNVYTHLYKLCRAGASENIAYYRTEAYGLLTRGLQSLALLNGTYYKSGFGKNREQVLSLPLQPPRLEPLMETIMRSSVTSEIVEACEELVAGIFAILSAEQEMGYDAPSYPDRMKGCYEEVKGVLDKIITACERNEYDTAFFSAIQAQEEIASFLFLAETGIWPSDLMLHSAYENVYRRLGFPELAGLLNPDDLSPLQTAVERLNADLEGLFRSKGVEINRFADIEEFEAFLKGKYATA
ncbi:kanamycin nucleotidyltransferase C-terminal domain-containing protein [Paenibacillus sp. sgz500992]|uniref:kanamycin nucleotidyltransferase C-terminal domain-containing protein n=1 Tax=Paenibacillus sp. sgz500992 TaxID=3242476 RepID=UPI0036D22B5E